MDDKTQRERLEQELRFLKESFEAEVISKEEFEKGKDRIERKLKEVKATEKEPNSTAQQAKEEQKNDAAIESKNDEKIKLKVLQDETEEHAHEHAHEPLIQIKTKEIKEEQKEIKSYNEEFEKRKQRKAFKYSIVFVVLALAVFFSYKAFQNNPVQEPKPIDLKYIACYSDNDCKQEGKMGLCVEPGSANAKCEFKYIAKTNVIVLNDRKNCFNCDTKRILGILNDWFGQLNVKDIDYNTLKGKEVSQKFDAQMLPMYILDENITQKPKFEQFKQLFVKKEDSYLLSDNAAGSTFYVKRENIPNKLDFFVKENDASSINAEKNLKEFLDNFNEVKFDKHNADDSLTKELGIKTFPTFLANNIVKFGGIQPAETIKENFCKLNKIAECEKTLSENLI